MIPLHIETQNRHLGFDIADSSSLKADLLINAPGGVTLRYQGSHVCKAMGIPEVLQFLVDASINIDLALFSAWLYDKLNNKQVERVVINRRVITEITPQTIRQVLEEEIRQ